MSICLFYCCVCRHVVVFLFSKIDAEGESSELKFHSTVVDAQVSLVKLLKAYVRRRYNTYIYNILYSVSTVEPPLTDTPNKEHLPNKGQDSGHQKVTFL